MELQNSFTVTADPQTVWAHLLEVENLVPCMPGAELVETVDDTHWRGRLKIKFGPVALAFSGDVSMVERDDEQRRLRLTGAGKDKGGRGSASADVVVAVVPGPVAGSSTVEIVQDLKVAGQIASFGRGMIADVSKTMTKQFADRLQSRLTTDQEPTATGGPAEAADQPHAAGAPAAVVRTAPREVHGDGAALSGFRIIWVVLAGFARRIGRRLTGRRDREA
ncbi:SRPBCC family protein [Blastococcus saxobsidens]|uniref:Carbon monoxide dehydrogenase subunit G n=1 Tax=Blastococcus saxobsidens (strain DD2) TaxID=1146883 RepID=H6RKH7_BLASD|nr:SRPBCC family protein [Blastococcus saxobsidens]CCG02396.1 carbon monoxide dehydrogenase subunit G [Blastococcus saxobsidens DD2]